MGCRVRGEELNAYRRPTIPEAVAHLADAQTVAYQRECIRYWREKFGDDFAEQVRNEARKRIKKAAKG